MTFLSINRFLSRIEILPFLILDSISCSNLAKFWTWDNVSILSLYFCFLIPPFPIIKISSEILIQYSLNVSWFFRGLISRGIETTWSRILLSFVRNKRSSAPCSNILDIILIILSKSSFNRSSGESLYRSIKSSNSVRAWSRNWKVYMPTQSDSSTGFMSTCFLKIRINLQIQR